jgi:hypothetical protein
MSKLTSEKLDKIMAEGLDFANSATLSVIVFDAKKREPQTATGAVIDQGGKYFLATAGHVIDELKALGEDGRIQIHMNGKVLGNMASRPIHRSKKLDIGVIALTKDEVETLDNQPIVLEEIPQEPVQVYDLLAYTGYPGSLKKVEDRSNIYLGRVSFIGAVETIEPDQFSVRIDPYRYESEVDAEAQDLEDLGGISGAPVFRIHKFWGSDIQKFNPQLVGFIHEGNIWSNLEQKHFAIHGFEIADLIKNAPPAPI